VEGSTMLFYGIAELYAAVLPLDIGRTQIAIVVYRVAALRWQRVYPNLQTIDAFRVVLHRQEPRGVSGMRKPAAMYRAQVITYEAALKLVLTQVLDRIKQAAVTRLDRVQFRIQGGPAGWVTTPFSINAARFCFNVVHIHDPGLRC